MYIRGRSYEKVFDSWCDLAGRGDAGSVQQLIKQHQFIHNIQRRSSEEAATAVASDKEAIYDKFYGL